MKIALTSNYTIGSETGASFVTDILAKKLSKNNNVLYICLGKKLKVQNLSNNFKVLTIPFIEVKGINLPIITIQTIIFVNKNLDSFGPDVVHNQNHVLISRIAQSWANLKSIPVVTTFHHIPTEAFEHIFPELGKLKITKLVQDIYSKTTIFNYLKKSNAVISINKKQHDEIKKINKEIKNIVINNGLELNTFLSLKKESPKDEFKFVFLGSYNVRKNQEMLIKTFKFLPENYTLHLYGNYKSGNEYLKKIKKLIKINNLKNIYLHDFIPREETSNIYKQANYFITASLKEVQSLSVIEALASGLPVIGLKNETINELINKNNGLKINDSITPEKMAELIIKFTKKNNYMYLSRNARKTALKFDINKTVLKIEKVYESLT